MDQKLSDALAALCIELTTLLGRAQSSEEQATPADPPMPSEPPARSPVDDLPEWLRVDEFASAMRISRGSVYEMVRRGDVQSRRFGKLVRIHRDELRAARPARSGVGEAWSHQIGFAHQAAAVSDVPRDPDLLPCSRTKEVHTVWGGKSGTV